MNTSKYENLTLVEAIETGWPFKRKSDPRWILWGRPIESYVFTLIEVRATDWMVLSSEDVIKAQEKAKDSII